MKYSELFTSLMGTKIHIKVLHDSPGEILKKCNKLLDEYNRRYSIYNNDSELMYVNSNAHIHPIKVNNDLFELIKLGKMHSVDENSNLNVCIGPIVKLWNIGFHNAKIPSNKELYEKLNIINPTDLILDEENKTIFFNKKGMEIDLGAVAKGYFADKILEYLKSENVLSAIINLGGNILTHGFNLESPDINWKIGLQDAQLTRGNHIMMLEINDLSIVTSGIYERKLIINDKSYHHIFDSKTGYPIETDMTSLSIISKKSVDCEIWSSKLFGKSFDEIEKICLSEKHIEAIAQYKNGEVKFTKGVHKYILWRK
ncbi:FAD:protein FMN transferase [Helcococcus ovis]|uniref:FAD:protein FMN transferase n=1 Tax=Helcococcus ovis TaxID=72026 RepID=UPI0038B8959B